MIETVLERTAAPIPATHDLRRRFKRLAPAALTVLVALGATEYAHD